MNMKQILLFLSIFCYTNSFFAQTLSPEVISSAGTNFTNGSNSLDWTLGEPVTSTLSNSNVLTQGFQQENVTITSLDESEMLASISIFPNPAVNIINVQFAKAEEKCTIELYSVEGKLVYTRSLFSETLSTIDMTDYSTGSYILKIKGNSTKSYQIIKSK